MKFPISRIITFLLALLFLASQMLAQGWVWQPSGTTKNLRGVFFTDAYHGIVVGDGGTILRTTNGGLFWGIQYSGVTQNIQSVAFGDSSNGIAVGDSGVILRTTDGGSNWTSQSSGRSLTFTSVSYPHVNKAVVVGDSGAVLQSTDRGITWTPQLSGTDKWLTGVSFTNSSFGIAVGSAGTILRTTNGGAVWLNHPSLTWHSLMGVSCLSDVGYVISDYASWYKTMDSGLTWTNFDGLYNLNGNLRGISFIDRDKGTVVGSGFICQTELGGEGWSAIGVRFQLKAVSSTGLTAQTAVGNNGAIVRTYDERWIPPDIELQYPADNSSDVPLTFIESALASVQLKWRHYLYTVSTSAHYRVQIGTDSTFQSNILVDYTPDRYSYNIRDTALIVSSFRPLTKYFWRVCVIDYGRYQDVWSKWSASWSFTTGDYPRATIRQIQEISHDSLLIADSLQNSIASRSVLQHSPFRDSVLYIIARCIYPPSLFTCQPARMVVTDTAHEISPWCGITVHWYKGDSLSFMDIQRGQILGIGGRVREEPTNNMNSNTVFKSIAFEVIAMDSSLISPLPVNVTDFFEGVLPQGKSKFSTGEQYEGSVVEFRNLTVHSILSQADGMFNLSDGAGNIIATSDVSRWFTLRSHRDPLSTYSIPPLGSHIDTIRGVLSTAYGAESGIAGYRYRIAPIDPGDIVFGEQRRGVITGTIYNDENRDSIKNAGEQGLANWRIIVTGKVGALFTTNESGEYSISGLDSGWYLVTLSPNSGWVRTKPGVDQYSFYLSLNDTAAGIDYGAYYQWCSIDGVVFYDHNENGAQESYESGVSNCTVEINGPVSSSVQTDSTGYYIFPHLEPGTYSLSLHSPSGFEQVLPRFQCGYDYNFTAYDMHSSNNRFAIRSIPTRIKLKISVMENTRLQKELEWGIRPGASYGIWRVDPSCTDYDYSEGETEIPPQVYGLFDARFVDPQRTSAHFGCGAYTDMRDFISTSQIDTFKLSFLPGYIWGGDYPMVLQWSSADVRNSFISSFLVDKLGEWIDMRWNNYLVVTDPAITSLLIVTQSPQIPPAYLRTWKMLSIPVQAINPRVWSIFRPSEQTGFSFIPIAGYSWADSLQPGMGYWIKCTGMIDSSVLSGPSRLLDTLNLYQGWNFIGALSSPTFVDSIEKIPSEMVLGEFFGYKTSYSVSDVIEPFNAYWVKASRDGKLIMKSSESTAFWKKDITDRFAQSSCLIIQDGHCNEARLYFSGYNRIGDVDIQSLELPPLPPDGIFDVRFSSNRMMEIIENGAENEYPILISSAVYPIKISWDLTSGDCAASLRVDENEVGLNINSTIEIKKPLTRLSLIIRGGTALPNNFVLHQNYPNPFNPITRIQYALPTDAKVKLVIYNTLGQRIVTLVDQVIHAGYQSVEWNASDIASGVYFYNLEATGVSGTEKTFTQIRKMIIIK